MPNVQKPTLVFFCGLAGTGKRTVIDALRKKLPNAIRLQKDVLSDTLLTGLDHTSAEYKAIKDRIYATLGALAFDNLEGGRGDMVAIMQGYYGDKLTKPGTVEAITRADVAVKIIYLHCDAATQKQRLIDRRLPRDKDKLGPNMDGTDDKDQDIFSPYRFQHIKNHLEQLAKVSQFLILDTADVSPAENAEIIAEYIQQPEPPITIQPINTDVLANLTMDDADLVTLMNGGIEGFAKLIDDLRPGHPGIVFAELLAEQDLNTEEQDTRAGRINPCDHLTAGAYWLYNAATERVSAFWYGEDLEYHEAPNQARAHSASLR